tara:strand:+ start:358 stop:699 length:342 start_codon:yes stop_codon:yes gene_type:complete
MEKEFIPYEQALALKELGFDLKINYYQHYSKFKKLGEKTKDSIPAPLYQQVFGWFNEPVFNFDTWIKKLSINKWEYAYLIRNERQKSKVYSSKEEAEFECLKELIEIVKINER